MRVVITTVIEIPEGEVGVNGVERAVTAAWRAFPTQAWNAVAREVEAVAELQHGGSLLRRGWEARWLWTLSGPVRLRRQRYTHPAEERSFILLDKRIRLNSAERVTGEARACFAQVAARGPSYEQARKQIASCLGEAPSTATLWQWVQEEGQEEAQRMDMRRVGFERDGELPGAEVTPKGFVGLEADSTQVHAWREKGKSHEVYLGLAYDGKETRGRRKRRVLTNKVAVTSLEGAARFGAHFFLAAQARHNVCEAQVVLYGSDGALALETIRDERFPLAWPQLDHAHVVRRTREAYGWDHAESAQKTLKLIFGEKRARLEQKLARDQRRLPGRAGALGELEQYVLRRWESLFTVRRLRKRLGKDALPPHVSGTGAIERNVGVIIGQRMKNRGMGWTKRGATHILLLRLKDLRLQAS